MGKGIVKLGEGNWAVKDGNLLAAKETNGRFKNAEFTVDRGSDATYVGRDGLIKQTSSNIESEVFLNPNFDTTIPLGNAGSGWSDSGLGEVTFYDGGLKITGEGVGTAKARARSATNSGAILETSRMYELTYTIQSISSKSNTLSLYMAGNTPIITQKSVGTHTILVASGTNANKICQFQWYQTDNESIVFSSVSLKESLVVNGTFDTDTSDWSKGNKWSIGGGKANKAADATSNISQAIDGISGKLLKVVFTVSNYGGNGGVGASADGSNYTQNEGNGTFTEYITPNSNNLYIRASYSFVGSIDNVSIFEINNGALPRIDFTNNTDGHLLLEPQSTNLLSYSQGFDHSSGYWNTPNTTVETTSITSPDGSNNTYKLFADTGSSSHYLDNINYGGASSGQTYTYSIFVKSAGSNFIQLASSSGFPARYQNFNLSTGAKASGNISDATIEAYPNGWYRISVTETTNSTSRRFLIVPVLTDNSRNPVFVGNNQEDGVYIYGAQLEQLSYATSYIPTNGGQVTRDAETCTGAGEAADFNSEEGVLYAEIAALNDDISQQIGVYGNSSTKQLRIEIANSVIRGQLFNGAYQANMSSTQTVTNFNKIALKWKVDDFALWINGTEVDDDDIGTTFSAATLDRVHFSAQDGSSSAAQAKVKALRVYKETDGIDLGTLTSL